MNNLDSLFAIHKMMSDSRSSKLATLLLLKRQIMSREVVVAVISGKLDFGPWEQIFYDEFDGQSPKRVLVKILGE